MDRYELVEEHSKTTRRCLNAKVREMHEMVIGFFRYRADVGQTILNENDAEWLSKFAKASRNLEELFDDRFGEIVPREEDKD